MPSLGRMLADVAREISLGGMSADGVAVTVNPPEGAAPIHIFVRSQEQREQWLLNLEDGGLLYGTQVEITVLNVEPE